MFCLSFWGPLRKWAMFAQTTIPDGPQMDGYTAAGLKRCEYHTIHKTQIQWARVIQLLQRPDHSRLATEGAHPWCRIAGVSHWVGGTGAEGGTAGGTAWGDGMRYATLVVIQTYTLLNEPTVSIDAQNSSQLRFNGLSTFWLQVSI